MKYTSRSHNIGWKFRTLAIVANKLLQKMHYYCKTTNYTKTHSDKTVMHISYLTTHRVLIIPLVYLNRLFHALAPFLTEITATKLKGFTYLLDFSSLPLTDASAKHHIA